MFKLDEETLIRSACLIDGAWVPAQSGNVMDVTNPATQAQVGSVPRGNTDEAEAAVAAANKAQAGWAARTAADRAAILRCWFDLVMDHQEDLARLMVMEQGKPLLEARGEIAYAASFIEWFAEEAKRAYGEVIPSSEGGKRIVTLRQPVGVAAAITPWNFPAAMITRKAAPALAAGCTMIVKPASQTPLSGLALGFLAQQAGVPDGVLNVITGEASSIGTVLATDPRVRKLSFTGSTDVGAKLMQQAAGTIKNVSMELGGNAPFIIFDDADIDEAIEGLIASKFRNTGQTCVCANRIFVQEGVYDEVADKLVAAVNELKVGPGDQDGVSQGPLIDAAALAKVEEHIADAVAQGGEVLIGGKPHRLGGTFFQPTVISGATSAMKLSQEETFGPIAPLFRFETEAQVIAQANDTPFGLAAYFYARDMGRVWRVAEALETGIVGINTGIISTAVAPFGGMKQSGVGREGARAGLSEYLETKYLSIGGINPKG